MTLIVKSEGFLVPPLTFVVTVANTLSNVKFYKITEKGIEADQKWVKHFLDFAATANTAITATNTNNEKQ